MRILMVTRNWASWPHGEGASQKATRFKSLMPHEAEQ